MCFVDDVRLLQVFDEFLQTFSDDVARSCQQQHVCVENPPKKLRFTSKAYIEP